MKAFFGDTSTYQTLSGYVDVQVISQLVFLTLIMGILIGSGLIAGAEGEGTLQTLLAQPIKRSTIYWQSYLAMIVIMLLASLTIFIAVFASGLIINESMDWWRLAQAIFGVWLITLVFSAAAYSLGAYSGKRALSGSVVGLLAFVTYLITSLAAGVSALKTVDIFSPFHYFNTPSIIQYGLDWGNVAVLVAITILVTIIGYVRFIKRDLS
jgi:ABC-2 type transport system permease protein